VSSDVPYEREIFLLEKVKSGCEFFAKVRITKCLGTDKLTLKLSEEHLKTFRAARMEDIAA
jgi:hypothetical protein